MTAIYLLLLAAVVTGVAALFVRRLLLMKEEFIRISPDDQPVLESEEIVREKLSRIDFWGKTLTAMSAGLLMLLARGAQRRPASVTESA